MNTCVTAEAIGAGWSGTSLNDDVLRQICGIPDKAPQITPEWMAKLRIVPGLLEPQRPRANLQLESALTLLASLLGQLKRFNPTHLPFGYEGPVVSPEGWIDRGVLETVSKQIVGLRWCGVSAQTVASAVHNAISEAVRLGFMVEKTYDAWRPGMPSGSGWRSAVSATPYGVIKANHAFTRVLSAGSTASTSPGNSEQHENIHTTIAPPSVAAAKKEMADARRVPNELSRAQQNRHVVSTDKAAQSKAKASPEAIEHPVLQLGRPGESCFVFGRQKKPLTDGQHAVVSALMMAGDEGLTKDGLEAVRPSARRILKTLREDIDWAKVVVLPGQTNGRYRIRL